MYIIIIMILILVTGIIIYEQDKRIKKLINETWDLGKLVEELETRQLSSSYVVKQLTPVIVALKTLAPKQTD